MLKNGGRATISEMIQSCENALDIHPIGKRTIEADIYAMRYDDRLGFEAPIEYDRTLRAYKYSDPDYSIDRFPINEEEVQTLRFAATILRQFRHIGYLENFEGTVQKLITAINEGNLGGEEADLLFIQLEEAPLVKGTEFISQLIHHIEEKEVLKIKYRKFDSDTIAEYIVHPYLIKEYRNRWYLVGFDDADEKFKIFGLERMVSMERAFLKEYRKKIVDFDRFFGNSIGITRYDQKPKEIIVAFSDRQARYLATQPLHKTQTLLRKEDGRYIFQFTIVPTHEFTAALLGWGSEVEVLEPEAYRKEVAAKIKEMAGLY